MKNKARAGTPRTLVLFDLDNTLTDSVAFWATAAGTVTGTLAAALKQSEDDIFALLRESPEQHRFSDISASVDWLDENGRLPRAQTVQEQHERQLLKSFIRHQWQKAERNSMTLYHGAFDLLEELKAKGTAVAIFTDAEAAVMIRRLWMLGYNAAKTSPGRDPHDFLDLIDHVYCRPSAFDDTNFLRHYDYGFVLKLKQKTTLWTDGVMKPSPSHAALICKDFSTLPAQGVMVGDSYKDGGCAIPLGMDFLWYEPGNRHGADTIAVVDKISDPGWSYGNQNMKKNWNATCRPTHSLRSLPEVLTLYNFAAGNDFQAHNDPMAHRLENQLAHQPKPMMGPATHLK